MTSSEPPPAASPPFAPAVDANVDRDLARRCAAGDAAAWQTFLSLHTPSVRRAVSAALVRRRGRAHPADVDNLTQKILLDLLKDDARKLAGFRGRSRLATWLTVVAARAVLNAVAADAARLSAQILAAPGLRAALRRDGEAPSPSRNAERDEERRAVRVALRLLGPRDQLLLRLIYEDGVSYADAARSLGVSPNSIAPLLDRARTRFRAILSEHHPELIPGQD